MQAIARLAERGCVGVDGPEAEKFLQGLITHDMRLLQSQPAIHAGLLSPQGKLLFEFMVVRRTDGFDLETDKARIPELIKRLNLYKLRAQVAITDKSAQLAVFASWAAGRSGTISASEFPDPRLPALGHRALVQTDALPASAVGGDAYHAHRIALGVPQAGLDYTLGDTFPHEACFDLLSGLSFDKGCFIGQEVVSRMEHRGTARKRFVKVAGAERLPDAGQPVTTESLDGPTIGQMGSSSNGSGLALIRLDRAAEALQAGKITLAGTVEVKLEVPPWAPYRLTAPTRTG
jgi:folate-binding protein YgfZ